MSLESTLAAQLLAAHPDEAAAVLETLSDAAVAFVLSESPPAIAAAVLSRLAPRVGATALGDLPAPLAREVVLQLGFDEAADLIRRMAPEPRERFVDSLDPDLAAPVRTLLEFPDGTAGSLMDSRVLALPLDVTGADAVDQIRATPDQIRYNLYVIDRERRLIGVLNLRELLLADPKSLLGDIARRDVLSIGGHEDRAAVLEHAAWREAHSLPVVDRQGVYLGAIRYKTWRLLAEGVARDRARRDATTTDALGDLFSTGMAGVVGALANLVSTPAGGASDDAR